MDSLWYKLKKLPNRKKQTLHSICVGFVCFFWLFVFTKMSGKSLCPVNNLLGVNCPGCGLTRGFISILKLDFVSACRYNILSVPLFFGIALYCILGVADAVFNTDYIEKIEHILSRKYMFAVYGVMLIVSVILNNRLL